MNPSWIYATQPNKMVTYLSFFITFKVNEMVTHLGNFLSFV
jgi:hypothetical protein